MEKSQKNKIIDEVYQKLGKSQAVYAFNCQGASVSKVKELRKALWKANGEMEVVKNTLAHRALQRAGYSFDERILTGQNALGFSYQDIVEVARTLTDFTKKMPQLEIKGVWLNKKQHGIDEVKMLATLPSRQVLLGQVVGGIAAPLTGFVGTLQGVLRNFVGVLKSIEKKKSMN
ncbi:MAG: 50S ribosomal protein L10 [Atribacterota bacterium]|nr:50S ribosomal protein L10 [Candidatus Atribacteria bacterium]